MEIPTRIPTDSLGSSIDFHQRSQGGSPSLGIAPREMQLEMPWDAPANIECGRGLPQRQRLRLGRGRRPRAADGELLVGRGLGLACAFLGFPRTWSDRFVSLFRIPRDRQSRKRTAFLWIPEMRKIKPCGRKQDMPEAARSKALLSGYPHFAMPA